MIIKILHREERMVILDPSQVLRFQTVKITNEEVEEEVNEDEKQIAADIKDYVDDHKNILMLIQWTLK